MGPETLNWVGRLAKLMAQGRDQSPGRSRPAGGTVAIASCSTGGLASTFGGQAISALQVATELKGVGSHASESERTKGDQAGRHEQPA